MKTIGCLRRGGVAAAGDQDHGSSTKGSEGSPVWDCGCGLTLLVDGLWEERRENIRF